MRLFRMTPACARRLDYLPLIASCLVIWAANDLRAVAAETDTHSCRQKLSKKGAMIFDNVQHKRTAGSNLEEIWKEETRDLITANILGREEATNPAMEALNCLRAAE